MLNLPSPPRASRDWWPEIARRCRCPQVGDPAALGDVVALGIEPGEPAGRIVAFLRYREDGTPARGMHETLVRCYQDGDTWFPTGPYRYGMVGVAWTPWLGAEKYAAQAVQAA